MEQKCLKCRYTWISRLRTRPVECPKCKSRSWRWNTPNKTKKASG